MTVHGLRGMTLVGCVCGHDPENHLSLFGVASVPRECAVIGCNCPQYEEAGDGDHADDD